MRRYVIAAVAIAVVLAGVLAFAADLNLTSVKVTVFSNTLNQPTIASTLDDGEQTPAAALEVKAGTPVTYLATLSGSTVAAGGTMTYTVYSDAACSTPYTDGGDPGFQTVNGDGVLESAPVTIELVGTYYWKARYSGDANNQAKTTDCGAEHQVLTVIPADPYELNWLQQPPASTVAGTAFITANQPKIEIQDAYENVVTTSTASIHLEISAPLSPPVGAVLDCLPDTDTTNDQAVASGTGIATFSGCKINKTAANYKLKASLGTITAESSEFAIVAGPPDHFVITGTAAQEAGATNDLTITAVDGFGNTATTYGGPKSLTFSGAGSSPDPVNAPLVKDKDGNPVPFSSPTTMTFVQGIAQAVPGVSNGVMTLYKAETAVIEVTDGVLLTPVADRLTVVVSAAPADKLAFIQQPPATEVAGVDFDDDLTVAVQDAYGNPITSSTASVVLAIAGDTPPPLGCVPNTVNAVSGTGIATFVDCSVDQVSSPTYTLTAISSGLDPATSNSFTITAAPAAKFLVEAASENQDAGTTNNLTITAQDQFGNTATGYDGDKQLTFSGAGSSSDPVTAPTVTSTSGAPVPFGTLTTIHFDDGVATVPGDDDGVMKLYKAETAHIAATDTKGTPETSDDIETAPEDRADVTVTHADFTRMKLELTSPQVNGVVFSGVTNKLTVLDDYGNPITDFNAFTTPVTITANAPLTVASSVSGLGASVDNVLNQMSNFSLGVADLGSEGMKYTGALGGGTFTATAGTITDNSESITINVGAADHFVFTPLSTPNQAAGSDIAVTITAKDVGGNTATGYSGLKTIQFSGASSSTNPPTPPTATNSSSAAIDFGQDTTLNFVNGVATTTMKLYKKETVDIVATQVSTSVTTTGTDRLHVIVDPAGASKLTFQSQPAGTTAGATMAAFSVRVEDAYGNTVTSPSVDIDVALDGSLSGPTTQPTATGVATFNDLVIADAGTYQITASSPSLTSALSSSFVITS